MSHKHLSLKAGNKTVRARIANAMLLVLLLPILRPEVTLAINVSIPDLLVNTESFQTIDPGDGTTVIDLRFGEALNARLYYDVSNARFNFTKSVFVQGALTATGAVTFTATLSGNIIHAEKSLSSSGTLTVKRTTLLQSGAIVKMAAPRLVLQSTFGAQQKWELRHGVKATGDQGLDFYDANAGKTRFVIGSDGNAAIGTGTTAANSRLYVWGGGNGANIDVRGDSSIVGGDQATLELEGRDYDENANSVRLQYYGKDHDIGTTMGFANDKLGILSWTNVNTALIAVENAKPLIFGTDGTERMRLTETGSLAIGKTTPQAKLDVLGTISGSNLTVSNNGSFSGALTVVGNAKVRGTLSGTTINANSLLTGSTLQGFGLYNCQGSANKLTYNSTTKKFLCEADQTGGGSSGNWSNTGSLQDGFDRRYVNTHGDTMTGSLIIRSASGVSAVNLNVIGGFSGSFLRVSGSTDIHGPLNASGAIRTKSSVSGAYLTFMGATSSYILGSLGIGKMNPSAKLDVAGTISGSNLTIGNNGSFSGTLNVLRNVSIRGTMSGKSIHAERGLSSSGVLTIDLFNTTTGTGLVLREKAYLGSGATLSGVLLHKTIGVNQSLAAPGFLKTYAANNAGRSLLTARSWTGAEFAYQPALFSVQVMQLAAAGGTTINGIGTTVTNDTTVSHVASETFGYMANFATTATNNDTAGTSSANTTFFRGSVVGANGFFFSARIGVVDTTSIRTFVGLGNQTIATMVGADAPTGHHIGFQFSTNRSDTNWQFEKRDGTTQNVVNTGVAFTANKVYDLSFYCVNQCDSVYWQIKNITDNTLTTGTTSSNLPGVSTSMRMVVGVSTLTTAAKNIRMQQAYCEADR